MAKIAAGFGSWRSPITSDLIASGSIRIGDIAIDGSDVYWIESRPNEGGRNVIVRREADGTISDVITAPFNARTRVHEYGGGSFAIADRVVYFQDLRDQRIYQVADGQVPQPITHESSHRYADAVVDRNRRRLICVRERHGTNGHEPTNEIAAVEISTGNEQSLVSGSDFFAAPRLSPNGNRLAWLSWRHPNMPWDGTELWIGEVEADGSIGFRERVAGGPDESIAQPEWSPDGILHFVSDRTGWWNLYRWRAGAAQPLHPIDAECGRPAWVFGLATYGFLAPDVVAIAICKNGNWSLGTLDLATTNFTTVDIPFSDIGNLRADSGRILIVAGSPTTASSVIEVDPKTGAPTQLRSSSSAQIDPAYLTGPRTISFPTEDGLTAYGFYYPPSNPEFTGATDELPPLLVKSHGGPTSATSTTLSLGIQFWTSRGFAVLDVNYGGSTGYGRAYRQRLDGAWGIVDVHDCINGARYLVEQGLVDRHRLAISGGSAGGYTTLCVLTFHKEFHVGASYYGVSDLEALALDTHKFEARYLDRLIGPYPERKDIYQERSPFHYVNQLERPVIFLQGLEDKVVLPNQAEMMVDALRSRGLRVAYVTFEGEQHGFRRAETIKRALDVELYFYGRVLGFTPHDEIAPVAIDNL